MTIEINDEQVTQMIHEEMIAGGHASIAEMIAVAVASRRLQRESVETFGDFDPGELDLLIAEGEADGETLDGEAAYQARCAARRARRAVIG